MSGAVSLVDFARLRDNDAGDAADAFDDAPGTPSNWPSWWALLLGLIALIGAIALAALLVGAILGGQNKHDIDHWPSPSSAPTGPPTPTPRPTSPPSASLLPPGCDLFAPSICSDEINTDTVNTVSTCSSVLAHTTSGEIPFDWSIQTLQGADAPVPPPANNFPIDLFPLNAFPTGSLPPGSSLVTSYGLTITVDTATISIIDDGSGEHILQVGEPEPTWSSGTLSDLAPPGNSQTVRVVFTLDTSLLPVGAQTLNMDVVAEYSTEDGFDFLTFSGLASYILSGFGPISAPYLDLPFSTTLLGEFNFVATYAKDTNYRQGFDNARIRIRNAQPANFPQPPPLGPPGLVMTLPASLEDYVCREISLCANDANVHVVNLTGTGLSFDLAGDYTQMLFVGGGPCCVKMTASDATHLSVQTPQTSCAQFCQDGGQACTTSFGRLSDAHVGLELEGTGIFPPTHENVVLTADSPSAHIIPCDNLAEYVGRRYLVSNAAGATRSIVLLEGNLPCLAHFQVGDPLAGRQRADMLQLNSDKGASVEFVVVRTDLIVVVSNTYVHRCDLATGACAPVDDMLSLFGGWWIEDGAGSALSVQSDPAGILLHIDDHSIANGRIIMEMYQGPPKYVHTPNVGAATYSLGDYTRRQTVEITMNSPFEFTRGDPGPFVYAAAIDPANPSSFVQQTYAWGINPYPALIARDWDPRSSFFAPYFLYRRIGAPYGVPASASQQFVAPNFLPYVSPQMYFGSNGFRDTRLLFDYYVQEQLYTYQAGGFGRGDNQPCNGIQSREIAVAFAQRIQQGETFVYTNDIVRVQRTSTSQGTTLIETKFFHNATIFSTIEISGVTGAWAGLNGVHRVTTGTLNPSGRTVPGTIDDDSDNPNDRSLHFYVEIFFDSTFLPADPLTGFEYVNGTMTVTHGPLTADMEYGPFMDMVFFYDRTIFFEPTHHLMRYVAYSGGGALNPATCRLTADTWGQIQDDFTLDPSGIHAALGPLGRDPLTYEARIITRGRNEDVSSRYVSQFISIAAPNYFPSIDAIDPNAICILNSVAAELLNDPSGETYNAGFQGNTSAAAILANPLSRHIPFENYVEPDSWKLFFWRTGGAPAGDALGIEFSASVAYPPYDGTVGGYLVGEIYGPDELPCMNCNFLGSAIPLNGNCSVVPGCNPLACKDGFCESNYEYIRDTNPVLYRSYQLTSGCGIIIRNYTAGHTIAYCYFANTLQNDPLNYLTARVMAQPGLAPVSNPRRRREAASGMVAPMFQRLFGHYGAEAIINDIRGNSGGSFIIWPTLAEFVGTQRARLFGSQRQQTLDILTPRDDWDNIFDPYNLTGAPAGALMDLGVRNQYPAINEANYPGSTNPSALVYTMSNWAAGSGGDMFPHAYSGDALDGNLGGGSIAKIVGNPVGTLFGCNGQDGATLPMVPESKMLYDNATGRPIAPLYMSLDLYCAAIAWPDRVTPSCARVPYSYPAPLSTLPGLSGSAAPPHDIETLWWPDIGWLPNTRPRLPGDNRPQTPTQPSERRDAWLEATVINLIDELSFKRRSVEDNADYEREVTMWREKFAQDNARANTARSGTVPLCGSDEIAPDAIPKTTMATLRYKVVHDLEFGAGGVDLVLDGRVVEPDELQRRMLAHFNDLVAAGAVCEHEDGSLGYTAAVSTLGLPQLDYE